MCRSMRENQRENDKNRKFYPCGNKLLDMPMWLYFHEIKLLIESQKNRNMKNHDISSKLMMEMAIFPLYPQL